MKRSTIATVGVLAVALIGGGTAMALSGVDEPPSAVETVTPTLEPSTELTATDDPSVEPTTEPIVAEEPRAPAEIDPEEAYLLEVRARLARIQTQIPDVTDEQLIAVGWDACERVEHGEPTEGMSLIEGEVKSDAGYYSDSSAIIIAARQTLCHPVTE